VSTAAFKTTRSSSTLPLTLDFSTTGFKTTTAGITLPLTINFVTNGRQVGLVYDAAPAGTIARGYVGFPALGGRTSGRIATGTGSMAAGAHGSIAEMTTGSVA
jgi:hypothetical protein